MAKLKVLGNEICNINAAYVSPELNYNHVISILYFKFLCVFLY